MPSGRDHTREIIFERGPPGMSHRGYLFRDGAVLMPCTLAYIHTLMLEILRIRTSPSREILNATISESHIRRLQFVLPEVVRLVRNPYLFPSVAVKAKFLAFLGLESDLVFRSICKGLLIDQQLRQVTQISSREFTKPLYLPDSKGWENFLLDQAPGGPKEPVQRPRTIPRSTFQIVPAVGMRIVADLEREEAQIVRFVAQSQISVNTKPAATTLMINFDEFVSVEEQAPRLLLPQHTQAAFARPNPFRQDKKIYWDLNTTGAESLEKLCALVHRLDLTALPFNVPIAAINAPNLFPMVALQSWDPAVRFRNLKIVKE